MKLFKDLLNYIEAIVNTFSNALVQTFLVYTTVVLIYKFFIEEQTTNYIPTFVTTIMDKVRNTYTELNFMTEKYGGMNRDELEQKYEAARVGESHIHKKNKEHNRQVINNALKMSVAIFAVFCLFTLITSHMKVTIHWYQLLLSAAITVVGTSYEYFFITQIIVKYHFIELTRLYDAMAQKVEKMSQDVVDKELVPELEKIVQKQEGQTMNNVVKSGINNIAQATGVLQNIANGAEDADNMNNIVNDISNGMLNEITGNVQNATGVNANAISGILNKNANNVNNMITNKIGNYDNYGLGENNRHTYTMNNVQNLINKVGNTLNDIDHNDLKNSVMV